MKAHYLLIKAIKDDINNKNSKVRSIRERFGNANSTKDWLESNE